MARAEGGTQTERREAREEASQTEEDKAGRRRRESRELAFTLAQGELAELAAQLEMEQAKSEEQVTSRPPRPCPPSLLSQVSEIELLSRRVDQLQRRGSGTTVTLQPGQGGSFIIKDLQSQVPDCQRFDSTVTYPWSCRFRRWRRRTVRRTPSSRSWQRQWSEAQRDTVSLIVSGTQI